MASTAIKALSSNLSMSVLQRFLDLPAELRSLGVRLRREGLRGAERQKLGSKSEGSGFVQPQGHDSGDSVSLTSQCVTLPQNSDVTLLHTARVTFCHTSDVKFRHTGSQFLSRLM